MPRSVWLLVLVLACAASGGSIASAQTDDAEQVAQRVAAAIAELDGDRAQTRRAAELTLREIGPAGLPFLPADRRTMSPGARERLDAVEQHWLRQRRDEPADQPVESIDLAAAGTIEQAYELIATQTGVEFDTSRLPATGSFNPPPGRLPFWHAVDVVLDQAGGDIDVYGGDSSTLAVVPRADERPSRVDSAAYLGDFRIEPVSLAARRILRQPELSDLRVSLTINWRPGRTPIGLSIPTRSIAGSFDNGVPVEPLGDGEETIHIATSPEIIESEAYLPLRLPLGGRVSGLPRPQRITSLRGRIESLTPGPVQDFQLALDDPAARQTIDAMTVSLVEVRRDGPIHQVVLDVELAEAGGALESHRQWVYENRVMVKLDGPELSPLGMEVRRQSSESVRVGYLFDFSGSQLPPPGSKLVYRSATSVRPTIVPFELQGIDLP